MSLSKEQINRALGSQVRAGMALRKMTIAQLAKEIDESESTIVRIRNGADVQVSKLYLIADALKISPVKLVQDAIDEANKNE